MTVSLSHLTTDTSIDPIAIRAASVKAAKPDQPAIMRLARREAHARST